MCTVTKDVETSRLSSDTSPHNNIPLLSKIKTTHRCCLDYSKETGISCQRSAARRNNGAVALTFFRSLKPFRLTFLRMRVSRG